MAEITKDKFFYVCSCMKQGWIVYREATETRYFPYQYEELSQILFTLFIWSNVKEWDRVNVDGSHYNEYWGRSEKIMILDLYYNNIK